MSPAFAIPLGGLIPLAGLSLSIPFLGRQQQGEDNIYGGINFGPSGESNTLNFQDLINTMRKNPKIPFLNFGKKDTFTEDFLQGKTTDKYPMSSEAVQGLKDQATLFNKDGDYVGGVLPSGIVESTPNTTFLQEQSQILDTYGRPIVKSNTSSTTSSTTSPNNNNNNNDKKDKNNLFKTIGTYGLAGGAFSLGSFLTDKIGDIFSKKDDKDEDDGKSDFEDITGITYEKAMEMQRKRENELMNKRALMGGIKDAGQYAYLGGQAQMEAAKNIGLNTQDMLRSMAYGQAALANTIAGASKTAPLARTYFS